jgi:hypothetical protein
MKLVRIEREYYFGKDYVFAFLILQIYGSCICENPRRSVGAMLFVELARQFLLALDFEIGSCDFRARAGLPAADCNSVFA